MIDSALNSIANTLNNHLRNRFALTKDKVLVANVVRNDDNKSVGNSDKITITLVNLKEERNLKNRNGNPADLPIYLNLYLLVSVYFGEDGSYEQALKELSAIISFLQANHVFTPQNTPDLDDRIEKIIFKMEDLDIQQLQNLWAMLGGKHTPSVVYKASMIAISEDNVPFGSLLGVRPS